MKRLTLILASLLLTGVGSAARAGELDAEFGGKAAPVVSPTSALGASASELDAESPDQACHRRYGYYRHRGFGYGGFGYGGFGYGRGYYGLGYRRGFGYGRFGW